VAVEALHGVGLKLRAGAEDAMQLRQYKARLAEEAMLAEVLMGRLVQGRPIAEKELELRVPQYRFALLSQPKARIVSRLGLECGRLSAPRSSLPNWWRQGGCCGRQVFCKRPWAPFWAKSCGCIVGSIVIVDITLPMKL